MSSAAREEPIVHARNLGKAYGAVQALCDVSFHIDPREVVGFAGDNGAGKSTLMKIVAGAHAPSDGGLWVEGQEASMYSPSAFRARGIEMVYQDLALCDNMSVYENVFLGREQRRTRPGGWWLDHRSMRDRARDLLERLCVDLPVDELVVDLSGGQRQMVAIARAIAFEPRLVIMDEPTAALSVSAGAPLLDIIRRLPDHGAAVMIVSHRLSDLLDTANRLYVLRRGAIVAELDTASTSEEDLLHRMAGLDPTARDGNSEAKHLGGAS